MKKIEPCPTCGKKVAGDCSRAVCPRRKPVTAQLGDHRASPLGDGGYRTKPLKDN